MVMFNSFLYVHQRVVGSPGDFGDACANSSLLEHCQTQGC